MGWMTRFEPATSGSTDRRSNQLSYIHHKSSIVIILIFGRFCQKNFPPRFCKPGQTNKQPPYKICRRRAQKSGRGTQFQALTHPPPGTPQTHQFHRARAPQGRDMQTRPRRALPHYLAGAAVCGAGKWRRLWRTWFCASTRSSAGHKHICKNLSILCWLPPKKVSCR